MNKVFSISLKIMLIKKPTARYKIAAYMYGITLTLTLASILAAVISSTTPIEKIIECL